MLFSEQNWTELFLLQLFLELSSESFLCFLNATLLFLLLIDDFIYNTMMIKVWL
jgi:hypothetical protein